MLDVAGRSPYRGLSSGELRDQRLEPLPIALAERRAGALAVIREDDESIGPRRIKGRLLDEADDAVEAPEGVASFDAVGPGVVRDLVVVDVVRVDRRGAAVHLLYHEGGGEMAQEHVRRGARERIGKTPVASRLDLPARLAAGLHELFDDLADRQHGPADEAVRTDEEPIEDMAATELARGIVDRRRGQVAACRVARKQVADGCAAVREQAVAVRDPAHDLARVRRVVRDQEALPALLPPAERRDPVVVAVKDARLTRRGLRREQRLPRIDRHVFGAHPPCEVRRPARSQLILEDGPRQAVDLDEDDAWPVGPSGVAVSRRELPDKGAEERVVVPDRQARGEDRGRDGEGERSEHGGLRTVDRQPDGKAREDQEREALDEDRRRRDEDDRERREETDQDRSEERRQRRQDERGEHDGRVLADRDPGDEHDRRDEREDRNGGRHEAATDQRRPPAAPAQQQMELDGVESEDVPLHGYRRMVAGDRGGRLRSWLTRYHGCAFSDTRPCCSSSMSCASSPIQCSSTASGDCIGIPGTRPARSKASRSIWS